MSPFPPGNTVLETRISPNGVWRVELADFDSKTDFRLYATPVGVGGVRRKIGGPLPFDNDVARDFEISDDSERVIYRQGNTALGPWELFSAPIGGGGGGAIKINGPLCPGGAVLSFALLPDARVRYLADAERDETVQTFVVPILGGPVLEEIFNEGFESGTKGGFE
jgi:hypothetical protein